MCISEFPILSHPGLPLGTFVILALDPMAYVAPLNDEMATKAAAALKPKRYLALIDGVAPIDFSRKPLRLKYDYRLVGIGLPQEGRGDHSGPAYSFAIAPNTAHPSGRPALHPSKTLPWPDLYLHTLIMVTAAVSRIYHDSPSGIAIPEEDVYRIIEDITRDEFEARPQPTVQPSREDNEMSEDYSTPWPGEDESAASYDDEQSEYSQNSDDESDDVVTFQIPRYEPFVEIWENLGVVDTPADPQDMRDELIALHQIGKDWLERKTMEHFAKKPRTSAWAANVAEADAALLEMVSGTGPLYLNVMQMGPMPMDDIRPQDAIDERLERQELAEKPVSKSPTLVAESPEQVTVAVNAAPTIVSAPRAQRERNILSRAVHVVRRMFERLLKVA